MQTCRAEGIGALICNGTRPADWVRVASIAARFPQVIPSFGVHPWFVDEAEEQWEEHLMRTLASVPSAVGECGLDRWILPRDEAKQERIFRKHLQIASELHRPITIHCLRAWEWLLDVLASEKQLPSSILIHSFGGSAELIRPLSEFGAYFSISANIFEPKRIKQRAALLAIPPHRLLLETDAPDMLPPEEIRRYVLAGSDGQVQNHPANLPLVYDGVAALLACEPGEFRRRVRDNAQRFLGDLWNERIGRT